MFNGIVKNQGIIEEIDTKNNFLKIKTNLKKLYLGESIMCSGICLTVSKKKKNSFCVNISPETIKRTNLKNKKKGDVINLEKSLSMGQDISGHLVFGHVDGLVTLEKIKKVSDSKLLTFKTTKKLQKFITEKCSVALDGISLTVNDVLNDIFTVNIIPFTWNNTSLKNVEKGSKLNIEIDMLARYVFKALGK